MLALVDPRKTYIEEFYENTRCRLEDLIGVMEDIVEWWESQYDLMMNIYIYIIIYVWNKIWLYKTAEK